MFELLVWFVVVTALGADPAPDTEVGGGGFRPAFNHDSNLKGGRNGWDEREKS